MPSPKIHDAIGLPFPVTLPASARADRLAIEDQVLALFDECAPALRRYVASFNLSPAATEDIVQDVFVALFRHLSLRRPETNLKGWLFQVAHNLALKQRQRSIRRDLVESQWDADLAARVPDAALNPEEQLAYDRRQRRLASMLQVMPERDRQCLYLRAEGLCYRDIARVLGVSLGTVAKSVVRAITRLTAADRE
jgi:RNA polymerase sigma-70 factor (ECF subfamily)